MIVSMTGYGKAVEQLTDKKLTVEIRALNSKNLDLNLRLPQNYRDQELPLRQMLAKQLSRGKVDLSLHVEHTGAAATTQLDIQVVESYMQQLAQLDGVLLTNDGHRMRLLEIATRFPDVFKNTDQDATNGEMEAVHQVIGEAVQNLLHYRNTEGKVLAQEFEQRIDNISSLLQQVLDRDKDRLQEVRARLQKAVQEIKEKVDANRFEQELIYYLEKYDITEEKVRLKNHLEYFLETAALPTSQGKKLGFISQEIGREINTIGSKANDAHMQQIVVQMKDELEKVKEQLLNVL